MRSDKVEDVIQSSEILSKEANRLLSFLSDFVNEQKESFDLKQVISGKDSSTAQVVARVVSVTEIIEKFNKNSKAELIPLTVITKLENALNSCTQNIETLINYLDTNQNSQGGLKTMNYSNFHMQMKNGQNINCQP